MQNRRSKETVSFPAQRADSVSIVDQPAAGGPGSTRAATPPDGSANKDGGAVAASSAAVGPASSGNGAKAGATAGGADGGHNASVRQSSTTSAGYDSAQLEKKMHKKDHVAQGAGEGTKYVLMLRTDKTCTVTINSMPYGTLESGKAMRVYLGVGTYIIQATGTAGGSPYTGRLEVKPENLSQVGEYRIPL
jgi:hypothetical protein